MLFALVMLGVAAAGWRLYRRFEAAINYRGIGRPYPIGNSALAFLGQALLLFGAIGATVAITVTFF